MGGMSTASPQIIKYFAQPKYLNSSANVSK